MRTTDIVRRAGRSLRQAKTRTLLTSLAIAVGAFTITLSVAAGVGGNEDAADIVRNNVNPRSIMVTKVSKRSDGPVEYSESGKTTVDAGDAKVDTLNDKDVAAIRSVSGVESAEPSLGTQPLYIANADGKKKFELSYVGIFDGEIEHKYAAGNPGKKLDGGIVISDKYSKALGFSNVQDAIGKKVQIALVYGGVPGPNAEKKTFNFTVRAVTEKSGIAAAASDDVSVDAASLREMHDWQFAGTAYKDNYMYVMATVHDEKSVEQVKKSLEDKGYRAQTAEDLMSFIFQFINVLQGILIGFGALAILTSIFGIVNTQYISVLERTQQIGLMKALGARRRDIGRLFRYEAAWVGFLGGVIGTGLALLVGLANPWITKQLNLEKGTNLLIFDPVYSVILIVSLMLVAVVAGYFPARRASKLDPIEALRTE